MPLISVLVPCHNAAPWLRAAVTSIQRQSTDDLEILIYDDGSTDGSGEIIEQMAAEDARIRPMGARDNHGIVHGLNSMLESASGAYIARMDADDICLPRRLERQLEALQSGQADLCGTWFQEFGDGPPRAVRWPCGNEGLRAAMLFQNTICHPTVMAKREVFATFKYRNGYQLAEDYDLFVRALRKFRLANLPEVLLRYRRHKTQATRASRARMQEITCRVRLEALQAQGIHASAEEMRIHNAIRAPSSIRSLEDLRRIEEWLLGLIERFEHTEAKEVIASQWVRAMVRAAPLGWEMWRAYNASPLRRLIGRRLRTSVDLVILASLRLDYDSRSFEILRRLGASA